MVHPDFLRHTLSKRQVYEIAWFYRKLPFGHDIDHGMMATIAAAFAGGEPASFMPYFEDPLDLTDEEVAGSIFPGLDEFRHGSN
jgi:hypothetical protein